MADTAPAPAAAGPPRRGGLPAWASEARETLAIAWPLIAAQLAQHGLTAVDTVMMGWLGAEYLAAGALGATVVFNVLMFGFGVVTALSPMISQAVGARRPREVRRTVRQGLWVCIALSAVMIPVIANGAAALALLGQSARSVALADDYLAAAAWQVPWALGALALRPLLATHGAQRTVFHVMAAAIGLNVVLNWLLMFGNLGFPRLELAGAGIATAIVNLAVFGALLRVALTRPGMRRYALLGRFWRADWPRFGQILRLGGPIGATLVAESGLFAAAAILMGLISTEALAAHAVAIQLASIAFMVPYGLSQATTVRVGIGWGAGDPGAARRAGQLSMGVAALFMSGTAALFWFSPAPLVGLFLDRSADGDAGPFALAVSFLAVAALFQLADGVQAAAAGALRGLGDTARPMALALVGYWLVGLPSAGLLGFGVGLGGVGVWLGLAAGLGFAAVVLPLRFARLTRAPRLRTASGQPTAGD